MCTSFAASAKGGHSRSGHQIESSGMVWESDGSATASAIALQYSVKNAAGNCKIAAGVMLLFVPVSQSCLIIMLRPTGFRCSNISAIEHNDCI